jgi:hypothetical protein
MIKHMTKLTGWTAALAALAATASAEVKINDNLALEGYAIGAFTVTEGTPAQNDTFLDSGSRLGDAVKVALNGKYGDFTGKVSLLSIPNYKASTHNAGLLDAYVTYTTGEFAVTAGKFNSWLGYESFDSPSNAFITYGPADNVGYVATYATGAKVEYLTKTFSAGISVRDSLLTNPAPYSFLQGDGEYSNDQGYEGYVLYSGIDKLTVFAGAGYQDVNAGNPLETYNVWAAYAATDKLTLVGSYASTFTGVAASTVTFSYTAQATYAINDKVSVSGRFGAADSQAGDYANYGVASTYTFTPNFSVKGEVSKSDFDAGASDVFFYAVQGLFKF